MRILIAEDEQAISMQYRLVLEERGHHVQLTENGQECVEAFMGALEPRKGENCPPFDVVILDYRMPKKDGLETAKEILGVCPEQRIMFASAYTSQTLIQAVKSLHKVVELLQKPFDLEYFVDAVEDKELYEKLERLNVRVRELRDYNVTHSQLVSLLAGVEKLRQMVLYDS